jgi:hypothetical protein
LLCRSCIILTNGIGDFKKQHYSGLIAKSNKIKTTWNISKNGGQRLSEKQALSLVLVNEILKDSTRVANAFNNIFITITEKLNILLVEKGDAISIRKNSFPETLTS